MKILIATSELHPYSKTGGLADMVAALAKALGRAGHEVGVVTPLYRGIRERFPAIKPFDWKFDLPLGLERVQAGAWTLQPHPGVTIYFVDQPSYFDRASLYQEKDKDYADNAHRFIFFSKCVVHLARYLPSAPEILHVHDWQTALVPILALHQKLSEGWGSAPPACLTIHNLAFQGIFPTPAYSLTNLPLDYFNPNGVEFYGTVSCLKAGICYADAITTVSPRYAREITTPEMGCGLDGVLRKRQQQLFGILNGVDYDEWNTKDNPHLAAAYDARQLSGKAGNKAAVQKEFGLPVREDVPLFGNISRLADQKGVDILLGALEEMLAADLQFVQLGNGAAEFERAFLDLQKRFPQKVGVSIGFNQGLSHRIEAGSDFFLMPSKFEPCGLNQMYSLRYGTIPIVRAVGGLDDSVVDITEDLERPTGIKFRAYTARALSKAIRKALVIWQHPKLLREYRRHAMRQDFSWKQTSQEYVEIFRKLLK